ncbi:hypothetical protein EU800_20905 [Tropicimonas sp. IMCC6043]|nr:hypothetical protein EU800_20905 [Tropicimonas sp. IMCC6043]
MRIRVSRGLSIHLGLRICGSFRLCLRLVVRGLYSGSRGGLGFGINPRLLGGGSGLGIYRGLCSRLGLGRKHFGGFGRHPGLLCGDIRLVGKPRCLYLGLTFIGALGLIRQFSRSLGFGRGLSGFVGRCSGSDFGLCLKVADQGFAGARICNQCLGANLFERTGLDTVAALLPIRHRSVFVISGSRKGLRRSRQRLHQRQHRENCRGCLARFGSHHLGPP